VYNAPADLGFAAAMKKVKLTIAAGRMSMKPPWPHNGICRCRIISSSGEMFAPPTVR